MENLTLTVSTATPPSLSLWPPWPGSGAPPAGCGEAAHRLARPLGGAWQGPPGCEASAPPGRGDRRCGDSGGRSVSPPSRLPGSVPSRRLQHGSGRLQPSLSPGFRYRFIPETGRRFCTARDSGRPLCTGRASPRSYPVPQTFFFFKSF